MINLFKNYGTEKVKKIDDAILMTMAKWDPKGMSEAEIKTKEQELEQISIEAINARNEFVREKQEYEIIKKNFSLLMAASERIQARIVTETNPAVKSSLEESLTKAIQELEKMSPELDREKQEAEDAEHYLNEVSDAMKNMAAKLKTSRAEFQTAIRDMKNAAISEQRARDKEAMEKRLAGITETGSSGSALAAMKKAASEAKNRAEAAKSRLELLRPTEIKKDQNILDALNEVNPAQPSRTIAERLEILKNR